MDEKEDEGEDVEAEEEEDGKGKRGDDKNDEITPWEQMVKDFCPFIVDLDSVYRMPLNTSVPVITFIGNRTKPGILVVDSFESGVLTRVSRSVWELTSEVSKLKRGKGTDVMGPMK